MPVSNGFVDLFPYFYLFTQEKWDPDTYISFHKENPKQFGFKIWAKNENNFLWFFTSNEEFVKHDSMIANVQCIGYIQIF